MEEEVLQFYIPLNMDCSVYDSYLSTCARTELDVSHCPHVAGVNCGGRKSCIIISSEYHMNSVGVWVLVYSIILFINHLFLVKHDTRWVVYLPLYHRSLRNQRHCSQCISWKIDCTKTTHSVWMTTHSV